MRPMIRTERTNSRDLKKPKRQGRRTLNHAATDLSVLIQHFQIHNQSEGKSPRTVEWYDQVLGRFLRWLEGEDRPTNLGQIDEMVVREYLIYLQARPGTKGKTLSSHSMYNRVNALRSFFGWLHRREYTPEHVLKHLKQPKTSQLVTEPLSVEEITQVYSSIKANTLFGGRMAALFSIMLDTGLRLSEVAGMKEEDVHLDHQYVKVMGKGAKERIVSFGVSCQKALLHYHQNCRAEPAHSQVNTFFLASDGYPLTPDATRSLIKRLAKASGIRRLHPHLLRHTYATMFLLNGGDVFLLKQNLGHSTLDMVQRYLHIASQQGAARSQGFSPLDRIDIKGRRRISPSSGPGGKGRPKS